MLLTILAGSLLWQKPVNPLSVSLAGKTEGEKADNLLPLPLPLRE
jgi:hypothetical protein